MAIRRIKEDEIDSCADILADTQIGRTYYPGIKVIKMLLKKASKNDEVYVYENDEGNISGFAWFTLRGAFASYPYLHVIAVSNHEQKKGIGGSLLEFYEQSALKAFRTYSTKSYLVTADFNDNAYDFYKRRGYTQIGTIASLFKSGVNERLMYKEVSREND